MRRWKTVMTVVATMCFACCTAFAQVGQAQGTQIEAKSGKFTLVAPAGWQYRAYEKLEEAPNAKLILGEGGLGKMLGDDAKFTDNYNLWWSRTGEQAWMMTGIASFHRIELEEAVDAKGLLEKMQKGALPSGIEIRPQQLGQYVGLLGGGVVQQPFYVAAAIIAQRKSIYVATIMGPQQMIPPQWANFAGLIASLKAKDLAPQTLEDFLAGKPLPEIEEAPAQAEGEDAPKPQEGEAETPAEEPTPQAED